MQINAATASAIIMDELLILQFIDYVQLVLRKGIVSFTVVFMHQKGNGINKANLNEYSRASHDNLKTETI